MARPRPPVGPILDVTLDSPDGRVRAGEWREGFRGPCTEFVAGANGKRAR
jgi:hypothetical protein